jgi:hypothetical protein
MAPKRGRPPAAVEEAVNGDENNAQLTIRIRDALGTVTQNGVFLDIVDALPLAITGNGDSGVQAPFQKAAFNTAIRGPHKTYTCGCNLFWTKMDFSPTPGVPVRMPALDALVDFYFATPSPMPRPVVVAITDPNSNPLDHRGALHAISPEELRCAMLFAIARDVARGAPEDDLKAWRCHVLSVTMQFCLHGSQEDMYFAACQLRENMGQDHESMSRTALQRVFEIARFRESQMSLHGRAAGTAAAVCRAYDQVKCAGNRQPYSPAAIDTAITIMSRMLSIPAVRSRLLEADAWPRGSNPFDSINKLEVLIRKGRDTTAITWLVDIIWYVVHHSGKTADSSDFTMNGLKGNAATGNRGYADVLIFKRDAIPYLLDTLPRELGLDVSWFTCVARPRLESIAAHMDTNKDPTWCAGVNKPTLAYLSLVEHFVDGTTYYACIKALVKGSKQPSGLALQPGVTELLADIRNEVVALAASTDEPHADEKAASGGPDEDGQLTDLTCTITIRSKDPKKNEEVKPAELSNEVQEKVQSCRLLVRHRVDAGVALVSKNYGTTQDLGAALGATAESPGTTSAVRRRETDAGGGSRQTPPAGRQGGPA